MSKCGIVAALLLACSAGAAADVITIGAAKDNSIYSNSGELSNGIGPTIVAGRNNLGDIRRGLIAFDIAGSLPAGAVITNVVLHLQVSGTGAALSADYALHRVLANWGEGTSHAGPAGGSGAPATPGDATWTHGVFPGSLWANAGGDFAPSASAMQTITTAGPYTWSSPAMVAEVQNWLNAPAGNFGWLIIGDESLNGSARRFESREADTAAFRPALEITYIPAPGFTGLAAAGALIAARRRRA